MENINDIPEINPDIAKEAGDIIAFALLNEIKIESVEPDVLGGVAIYISNELSKGYEFKQLWISLLNNKSKTIISYDAESPAKLLSNYIDFTIIMDYLFSDTD